MAKRKRSSRRRARPNPIANGPKATIALGVMTAVGSAGYALYKRLQVPKLLRSCGRKYVALVVTSGGLTIDHPYSWPAAFSDYEQWRELARRLNIEAIDRWTLLGEVECEASGGTNCSDPDKASSPNYARYNELVDIQNRMVERYKALPSFFTSDTPAAIAQAQSVIADALCLMQRSDEGIRHYGGTVPETTTLAPDIDRTPWYLWTGLAGVGLTAIGTVMAAVLPPSGPTTVVVTAPKEA